LKGFIEHHKVLGHYMARHIDIQDHLTESRVAPQSIEERCNLSDAAKMYFPV
jgi:hypothetical protein